MLTFAPRHDASESTTDQAHSGSEGAGRLDVRGIVHSTGGLGVAAALPFALAIIGLAIPLGWKESCTGVFGNWRHSINPALTRDSAFYRAVSGFDQAAANVATILYAAILVMIGIGAAFLIDRLLGRWIRSLAPAIAVGLTAAIAAVFFVNRQEWSLLPALLPLLLPIVIGVSAVQTWRSAALKFSPFALCLTAVFALGLLPKILLNVRWSQYGFVLAMPGTLLLVHLLIQTIPAWLQRNRGSGTTFRAIWVGVLTLCGLMQFLSWNRIDQMKTQTVGEGSDRFYADPHYDNRVLPTVRSLAYLRRVMTPDDTLCVIPEGATLNYLLRKRNPTGFLIFNPWEFDVHGGESRILGKIAQNAPKYIVFVGLDMTEHGRGNFGDEQFGKSIREYIDAEYKVVDASMQADPHGRPDFQAIVYQRRHSTD